MSVLLSLLVVLAGLVTFVCRLGLIVLTAYSLVMLVEAAVMVHRDPAGGGFIFSRSGMASPAAKNLRRALVWLAGLSTVWLALYFI